MLIFRGCNSCVNYLEHIPSHKCPGSAPHPQQSNLWSLRRWKNWKGSLRRRISGVFFEIRKAWVDLFFFGCSKRWNRKTRKQHDHSTKSEESECPLFFWSFKHPPQMRFPKWWVSSLRVLGQLFPGSGSGGSHTDVLCNCRGCFEFPLGYHSSTVETSGTLYYMKVSKSMKVSFAELLILYLYKE